MSSASAGGRRTWPPARPAHAARHVPTSFARSRATDGGGEEQGAAHPSTPMEREDVGRGRAQHRLLHVQVAAHLKHPALGSGSSCCSSTSSGSERTAVKMLVACRPHVHSPRELPVASTSAKYSRSISRERSAGHSRSPHPPGGVVGERKPEEGDTLTGAQARAQRRTRKRDARDELRERRRVEVSRRRSEPWPAIRRQRGRTSVATRRPAESHRFQARELVAHPRERLIDQNRGPHRRRRQCWARVRRARQPWIQPMVGCGT